MGRQPVLDAPSLTQSSQWQVGMYLQAYIFTIGAYCHSLHCVSAYAVCLLNSTESKFYLIPQGMFAL